MIMDFKDGIVTQKCDVCEKVNTVELEPAPLEWLPEFNEYRNLALPECECGTTEVLNMNLPEDEHKLEDVIPEDEWKSRCFIKEIKRYMQEGAGQ